ncbi:probable E3 ubiquitin-protein ligase LUL4 [Vigna unguiculata]|uniref:probable E3 ubiquitin-protein ligase LUL4 n=1 Tax=Vigna unguiculata TaxID=3917 RepID=UPI001016E6C1|nr:probable E3 ubiquitin-protein ligase LUL4 [Vigna unguiculata]
MGVSWSNNNRRRRRSAYFHPHPHPHPPHLPPPYYYPPPLLPPAAPPPQGYFVTSTNPSASTSATTGYVGPPPPQYYPNVYTANSVMLHQQPLYANEGGSQIQVSPPPYVDHQTTKKIRNDVNLHKHTLRLCIDPNYPDHHLISFDFDALFDGSITIFYLAKEEEKCRFNPLFPDLFEPITFPLRKGAGQKFCQPSGTGIDLGFFELDDLSQPSSGEDIFPLVICAETNSISVLDASPHMQITQAVLEKNNGVGPFQVKVVRQILWIDDVRYELRELYGIGSSATADFEDNDHGKECVICMTEPKDTAVLPCRHMCMCSECAKALRFQSNKCPICRQPIEELIEIRINSGNQ